MKVIVHFKNAIMNLYAPVSSLMTTKLITVHPSDKLAVVKELFDKNKIHHLPVVKYKEIVGMISKSDLLSFLKGFQNDSYDDYMNNVRLKNYTAEDIMTKGLAKLEPNDRVNVALEVFKENLFHALPVVDNGELVGIITTLDIIRALANEPANTGE
jgi:acetoin utilization protein AcuB